MRCAKIDNLFKIVQSLGFDPRYGTWRKDNLGHELARIDRELPEKIMKDIVKPSIVEFSSKEANKFGTDTLKWWLSPWGMNYIICPQAFSEAIEHDLAIQLLAHFKVYKPKSKSTGLRLYSTEYDEILGAALEDGWIRFAMWHLGDIQEWSLIAMFCKNNIKLAEDNILEMINSLNFKQEVVLDIVDCKNPDKTRLHFADSITTRASKFIALGISGLIKEKRKRFSEFRGLKLKK